MLLVDTNVCIDILRGREATIRTRFADALAAGAEIGLSVLVRYELEVGALKSAEPARARAKLDLFLKAPMTSVGIEVDDVRAAAALRAKLENAGRRIGPIDTLLAGQALARGARLVTSNVREFERVDALRVVHASARWADERRAPA
jgi:tRNA(fMet)-specific endonuclease VapC